jgi:UDP-N-acetylglucosamine 2-epimerase (non-hydrolysing)
MSRHHKILVVAGARPNFIKVAPLLDVLRQRPAVAPVFVHTGQHYDYRMSKVFFEDLSMPTPDYHLDVGSGTHAEQTAKVMLAFEPVLVTERPHVVVVVGDVNSTLACAITAAKLNVPVAHVESGLRSFDPTMPEETNRRLTDAVSDLLFTPSEDGDANLLREGVSRERIHFVGNIMIDTLRRHEDAARARKAHERYGFERHGYALVTLHRPSNVDDPRVLDDLVDCLDDLQRRVPVLFPAHPRTRQRLDSSQSGRRLLQMAQLQVCDPVGYLDFLGLLAEARIVLTDSGGVQEETTALNVPCLTLRMNTERPVTVTRGTNRVVGTDPAAIASAVTAVLGEPRRAGDLPPLWDGATAPRIVDILTRALPGAAA